MDFLNHAATGAALGLSPLWSIAPDSAMLLFGAYQIVTDRRTLGQLEREQYRGDLNKIERRLLAANRILHSPITLVVVALVSATAWRAWAVHVVIDAITHGTAFLLWPSHRGSAGLFNWASLPRTWRIAWFSLMLIVALS